MKGLPKGTKIPPVRPMNGQMLVYLEQDADSFSAAPSIVKPDSAKADHVFRIGRVVKKGPGEWNRKKTKRLPIQVELGSRVLFIKFVATHTKTAEATQVVLGDDFAFLREQDILLELDEEVSLGDIGQ